MIIKTHVSIDSAHKLELPYESKCNNLHGHRWEIDIEIKNDKTICNGMIIDFSEIKKYFNQFDHCYLNDKLPKELKSNPTAEHLAWYWANELKDKFKVQNIKISVAETPKNIAIYEL